MGERGRPVIEVLYDSTTYNYNEAIATAYALHGIRPGQAKVIAKPAQEKIRGGGGQVGSHTPLTANEHGGTGRRRNQVLSLKMELTVGNRVGIIGI
jgi:hypothetical protein